MERHEVLDMMRALRLSGMRTVFDEIVAVAIKRGHPVQRVIGELLKAEIADKKARSIKYQMTIAKLPTVKELADFDFASSPVNELLDLCCVRGYVELAVPGKCFVGGKA